MAGKLHIFNNNWFSTPNISYSRKTAACENNGIISYFRLNCLYEGFLMSAKPTMLPVKKDKLENDILYHKRCDYVDRLYNICLLSSYKVNSKGDKLSTIFKKHGGHVTGTF